MFVGMLSPGCMVSVNLPDWRRSMTRLCNKGHQLAQRTLVSWKSLALAWTVADVNQLHTVKFFLTSSPCMILLLKHSQRMSGAMWRLWNLKQKGNTVFWPKSAAKLQSLPRFYLRQRLMHPWWLSQPQILMILLGESLCLLEAFLIHIGNTKLWETAVASPCFWKYGKQSSHSSSSAALTNTVYVQFVSSTNFYSKFSVVTWELFRSSKLFMHVTWECSMQIEQFIGRQGLMQDFSPAASWLLCATQWTSRSSAGPVVIFWSHMILIPSIDPAFTCWQHWYTGVVFI